MELLVGFGLFIVNHAPELIGLVLPPFIERLNRDVPNDDERHIVSILTCIVIAILLKWKTLMFGNSSEFATTFALIYFESNNVFNLYFKNSYLRARIQETFREDH